MKLLAPESYHAATQELRNKVCNGCGPAGLLGKIVPEQLIGADVSEACNIHDWMYHEGEDKQKADLFFLANMILICSRGKKWLFPFRMWLAGKYFLAVHYGGSEYFNVEESA